MLFSFLGLHFTVNLVCKQIIEKSIRALPASWLADLLPVPHFFCIGPLTLFQLKQQCFCYFICRDFIYSFLWKQTPLMKKNFLFWKSLSCSMKLWRQEAICSRLEQIQGFLLKKPPSGPAETLGTHFLVGVHGLQLTTSSQPAELGFAHHHLFS